MMYAYNEVYLAKARVTLACMFDYAVNTCKMNINKFYEKFINSEYSVLFACGDTSTIAGKSGIELAYEVMTADGDELEFLNPVYSASRSPEYWLGFYLAYYQWVRNISFSRITENVEITDILLMYKKYHEMDILAFVEALDDMRLSESRLTRLKVYRTRLGLSQKQLANQADIPLRTLQQYEQRQKNINNAKAEYVLNLSKVLYCKPEDILE